MRRRARCILLCWHRARRGRALARSNPHADRRVLKAAAKLRLCDDAKDLAGLVDNRADFARLTAALVRIELSRGYHELEDLVKRDNA